MNRASAKRKILQTLNSFKSYDDMHKFLESGTVGTAEIAITDIIGKIPGFQDEINTIMLNSVISEQGNPDTRGFTFSKDISNERILEFVKGRDKAESKLATLYGTGEDREQAIESLEQHLLTRNEEYKSHTGKIENLQDAIAARRDEFDKKSKYSIFSALAPAVQAAAGWYDYLFASPGLEKIENRMFYIDPGSGKLGPPIEIRETQQQLKQAYQDRKSVVPRYQEYQEEYQTYDDIISDKEYFQGMLNKTGVDEALNYASLEQLTKMLEESQ